MSVVKQYLSQLNIEKRRWRRAFLILAGLSLIVAIATVWNLRMTGITIANSACCGRKEHLHAAECYEGETLTCDVAEHLHDTGCYSDPAADVETAEDWEKSLPTLTGIRSEDLVQIALSQLGTRESERNFALGEDGVTQCGITRYGQWYGNPYGDWSNMFTSFCLRYAGMPDTFLNSSAEIMRSDWAAADQYCTLDVYTPSAGDVIFLDKNGNGQADATGILVSLKKGVMTLVEGDVENSVCETTYTLEDDAVMGCGVSAPEYRVMMYAASPTASGTVVGSTVNYTNNLLTQGGSFIVYTTGSDGAYYAIDGNGNAVKLEISGNSIYADVANPNTL